MVEVDKYGNAVTRTQGSNSFTSICELFRPESELLFQTEGLKAKRDMDQEQSGPETGIELHIGYRIKYIFFQMHL